jgi:hypothetical protein
VLLWVSQTIVPEFFLSQVYHAWIFLSRFSLPVRLLILLKMMLCSTALSRVSVTVLLLGWIRSLFKQVWKKLCTLQVFLMLQLCLLLLENLFDSESWQTRAHRYGLCPHSGYVTLQNLFRSLNMVSDGTEFWFTSETRFCAYR